MTELEIILETDPRRRSWLRNPDIWAPGLLVLLGVFFFSDLLFSSKNFFFRDILNFHYPLRRVLIDSYARGEFPLWNPFIYLGQPMLANPNYMAFYPTNLLHLFLPFNYAFKFHFILHPILAGVGLYFLQRRLSLPPMPSLLGAVAYEFSGAVLSFLNLYNIIPAVALLPWIGWAFLGALERNWFRRSLGFGALLALQVIAFEPLMFLCNVWLLAGLALCHLLESTDKVRSAGRSLRIALVGGLFAVGLAAVQVLPTLELLPRSSRGSGFGFNDAASWSMHPLDLLNAIIPNLYGNYYKLNLATSWGESLHEGRENYLISFFLGSSTILFAALSFYSRRKKLQATLACLALGSVALALGKYNPLNHWLFENVPLFRLGRYPSKYFLLSALLISILASLGSEVVLRHERLERRARLGFLVAGGCGMVLGLVLLGSWLTWPSHVPQVERWVVDMSEEASRASKDMPAILSQLKVSVGSSGVFLLLASVLAIIAPFWRRAASMGGLLLLLIAAELLPANLRLSPLISDADVDYVPEVNRYLSASGLQEPCRVVPPTILLKMSEIQLHVPNRSSAWLTLFYRMSGQPFYGIMNGIQYSLDRPVDHLATAESEELWKIRVSMPEEAALPLLARLNSPMILSVGEMHDPRMRLIAKFGTRSNFDLNVYWLENTISRAYFVSNVEIATSHADALRRFLHPDFPFGNTVVLEDSGHAARFGQPPAGSAKIERYQNRRVTCRVEARNAGYLVLLDNYYPGWNAYLDGARVEILRANYAFRAVAVPAGSHTVEFLFRPLSFYWGLGVSLATLLGGVLACAYFMRIVPE
jgi:hypothetical protein